MAKTLLPRRDYKKFIEYDFDFLVGLDEAGAGCLAGPLSVAAFVIPKNEAYAKRCKFAEPIVDSKTLLEPQRDKSFAFLQTLSDCTFHFREISVETIEEKNIYWARMETFLSLVLELDLVLGPRVLYVVDGPRLHVPHHKMQDELFRNRWDLLQTRVFAYPKADGTYFCVAAASLVAKVRRDRLMIELGKDHPQYNWQQNKGYATQGHWEQINVHGLSKHHRKSFCGRFFAAIEGVNQESLDL